MPAPSKLCRGLTATGRPCKRTTRSPSGWCGSCAGVPPVPAGPTAAPGGPVPPPDPLAGPGALPAKEWQPPRDRAKIQAAAQDPGTSPAALDVIARSAAASAPTDTMAMMWVGENPTAAPETLRFLVGVRDRTPTRKLGLNHTWVEAAAARNAATPDDALALLAGRPPTPNLSPNVAERSWLRSPHKQWVARNPGASLRTLTVLAGTVDGALAAARWATDPGVVDRAVATAVDAGRVPEGPIWTVLAAAAENPAVSDDQLVEFIGHDGPDCPVARNAARRAALSATMAERLAAHPDFYTRLYLVQRQGDLPPDLVARVASDPETHPAIREAAAAHPCCPPAARAAAGLLAG